MALATIFNYGNLYFTGSAASEYEEAYPTRPTSPVVAEVRTITVKVIDGTRGRLWFDQNSTGRSKQESYEDGVKETYYEDDNAAATIYLRHYYVGGNRVSVIGSHPTCDFDGIKWSSSGIPTYDPNCAVCSENGCVTVRAINASSDIIVNKVYGNRTFKNGNYDTLPTYLKSGTEYDANKIVYDNTNGRIWFGLNVSLDQTFVVHVGYHHWLAISANGGSGTVNNTTQTVNSSKNYLSITDVDAYNQSGASSSYTIRSSKGGTFSRFQIVRQGMGMYYPSETHLQAIEGLTPPEGLIFKGVNTKADGTGTRYVEGDDLSGLLTRLTRGNNNYETRVLLYAEWGAENTTITRTGEAAGTLQLRSSEDDFTEVLAESVDGVLRYETKSGVTYRVSCVLTSEESVLYTATGVNGAAVYDFAGGSDVSLDYVVSLKMQYRIELAKTDEGSFSITSPSEPDGESGETQTYDYGYYVAGRNITVQTTPTDGYNVTKAYIDEILSGGYSQIQEIPASAFADGKFTIPKLSQSIRIRAEYEAKMCAVSATIDTASADAISGVTVKVGDDDVQSVAYGTEVTFTATMVSGSGCSFEGFYIDGVRVSDTSPMTLAITSDTAVVAKAKCAVTLALSGADGDNTVHLTAGGAAYNAPVDVTLGQSLSIGVTFDETSTLHFDHWAKGGSLVALLVEDTITPTQDVTYTAYVAEVVTKTLKAWLMLIGTPTTKLDSVDYPGTITFADVTPEEANMPTSLPLEYGTGGSNDPEPYEHERPGMGYVRVTAAPTITIGEGASAAEKNFNCFATAVPVEGEPQPPEDSIITRELSFTTLLAASETEVYAYYGEPVRVTVGVDYVAGQSARCGEIAITATTDPSGTIAPDGKSASCLQGKELTLVAIPANGWRFVGWFDVPEMGIAPVATDGTYTVVAAQTLYARFEADTAHAVKRWEGSDINKTMTWRSKTFEASKPFNPAACRVDARRYPDAAETNGAVLEFTVDMYSAPDAAAKPSAHTRLPTEARQGVITSQDARRLPVRRMERYMQVEVKANNEVDALLVGTSMEGLAQ